MPIDQSKIGRQVVADQMEAIEADYGDDCEIGDVCTIVEVVGPHGSHVRVRTSDMRPHSGARSRSAWPNRRCSATSGGSKPGSVPPQCDVYQPHGDRWASARWRPRSALSADYPQAAL